VNAELYHSGNQKGAGIGDQRNAELRQGSDRSASLLGLDEPGRMSNVHFGGQGQGAAEHGSVPAPASPTAAGSCTVSPRTQFGEHLARL